MATRPARAGRPRRVRFASVFRLWGLSIRIPCFLCFLYVLCGSYNLNDSYKVDEQSVAQLRFEPRGLGRHDVAGVGDGHQVADADRVQRESERRLARIDEPFELARAARAADEVNPLVRTDIAD